MKLSRMKLLAAVATVLAMFCGEAFNFCGAGIENSFMVSTAFAQAPAAPAAGGEAHQAGPPETLADYWAQMGPVKWALLASIIWVTALIVELVIRGRVKYLCPPEAVAQLMSTLAVKDYVKAWQYCIDNQSALTRTMSAAIEKIPQGATAAMDAAMDPMNFQNNIFKVKCSYLNLNATVNTLLGLLGTISGMISAFNKMAYAGATGDPAKLAGSIGEALLCTFTGLAIAIVSLYLFYVLTNRTKAAMTGMQNIVTRLIEEIDFDSITPDMEIITSEMKARAMGVKGGAAAASTAAAPRAAAAPKAAAAEMAECPNCHQQVKVGSAKCPNCNNELEWE